MKAILNNNRNKYICNSQSSKKQNIINLKKLKHSHKNDLYDMKIELNTIKAIIKLLKNEDKLPYAACLLCYTLIERILKWYVFKNRNNLEIIKGKSKINIEYQDIKYLSDKEFIEKVLCKNELGKIEGMLKITGTYSKHRNNIVHSNFFLTESSKNEETERQNENEENAKIAVELLNKAFKFAQINEKEIVAVLNDLMGLVK